MKRHGRTLNAYNWVKEADLKRLQIVWFQLYDILEKEKLWRQKKISGWRVGGDEQVEHRGLLGQRNYSVLTL